MWAYSALVWIYRSCDVHENKTISQSNWLLFKEIQHKREKYKDLISQLAILRSIRFENRYARESDEEKYEFILIQCDLNDIHKKHTNSHDNIINCIQVAFQVCAPFSIQ